MTKSSNQLLCEKLMGAETQATVIAILSERGYWQKEDAWRLYGDVENNNGQVHGQQDNPDGALVEKITNSCDALLIAESWDHGIDPTSSAAPSSIQDAVSKFLAPPGFKAEGHRFVDWGEAAQTAVAKRVTLAATGNKPEAGSPCLVISDSGEGQTPAQMPETFLSLNKGNKIKVHFVQGKFNMGGTGVLRFCGEHGLQFILTRRKPGLPVTGDLRDDEWGFTIVRREDTGGRATVYTYLAPVKGTNGKGQVLSFKSSSMPIFPDLADGRAKAFTRDSEHGTAIKLYEYALGGNRSNIVQSNDGLRQRLELHLCSTALPIRVYECRDYRGHQGSFDTNLLGTVNRLQNKDNLEAGFPISIPLVIEGESFPIEIFAFLKGKARSYKRSEGVVFTLNGQLHGSLPKSFFGRSSVNLGYLKDDLLVVVELGKLSARVREDLIMSSRDRLTKNKMFAELESELTTLLKNNQTLRSLQQRRREEDLKERLADDKPMHDLLKDLLKRSPDLARILGPGDRLTNPFDTRPAGEAQQFRGKQIPTFFRFKGKAYGETLRKDVHHGGRCRIEFETDAVNDFFSQNTGRGSLVVVTQRGTELIKVSCLPNLSDGRFNLHLSFPEEVMVNDELCVRVEVLCDDLPEPFVNLATIRVLPAHSRNGGGSGVGSPKKPDGQEDTPTGIPLPNIVEVEEKDWAEDYDPPMTRTSAIVIKQADAKGGKSTYDYHVNMDNVFLKTDLKSRIADSPTVKKQFQLALVLVSMCIVNNDTKAKPNSEEEVEDVEMTVRRVTEAIAPVMLPMIRGLANLGDDETGED